MCGIAGLVNFADSYVGAIQNSLFHRGPDAQTQYSYKNLHLIHTRLSIQDIKHGNQPFTIGQHVIIFNGEIYNHIELRKKIHNYIFKTNSDTETLLALYIEFGISALEMCDGMFAFVILDKAKNKLIMARDRVGKKPLYLFKKDKQIFFASELNTILNSLSALSVDEDAIYAYLRIGFFHSDTTPYNHVEEVLPGHYYEINISSLQIKKNKYFDISDYYQDNLNISSDEALNQLDSILRKSIRNRLISSELDVGVFLSSGIDSSVIVAIASEYVEKIKTFTVKFDGVYDESILAAQTSKKFSTSHNEISVSMDLKNDVEKILTKFGEPFMDSSAIPSYYISREAKKYLTVVLNGDGADELFGGYRRYVPIANNWINYVKYFSFLQSIFPNPQQKQNIYNYLFRLFSISKKESLDFYLSATTDIFEDIYSFKSNKIFSKIENFINDVNDSNLSDLSKIQILDTNLILPSDLLKKMDIATMSNSLEARSPFLSKYFLEWAPKLDNKNKVNGTITKSLLRSLALRYSLNEIHRQPKKGFEVPLSNWVEGELRENIFDSLNGNSYSKSYFDAGFIDNILKNKISISREKRAKILWSLYSLEIWHKNYLANSFNHNELSAIRQIHKTKVLFLTTGLGLGGAERVIFDICKNINKNEFEVSVISISKQQDLLENFLKNGIDAKVLNLTKTFRSFIYSVKVVYKHIKKHNIDLIHVHMFHTLLITSFLRLFLSSDKKIIFTLHNDVVFSRIRRLILWFLKPFYNYGTIFSLPSLRYFHKSKYEVIPNGIDINLYKNKNKNKSISINKPFTFISIGRLEVMKNHSYLIDLANELDEYDFQILFVGHGKLEQSLKNKVFKLNLNSKIHFLGARNDVPKLLEQSDCLLLPSLWEGFPIVLLEAAATNIPVITTNVGSISSLVDKDNGYITNLDGFKSAMLEVMDNFSHAKEKSEKLNEKVKSNYQIDFIVKKYESLYKKSIQ